MSERAFSGPSQSERHVRPEAKLAQPEVLTTADLSAQADYIAMTIARHEKVQDGYVAAHQAYVEQETRPDLQKFGKLLLLAPLAARHQTELSAFQQRSQQGRTTPEEKQDYEEQRRAVCAYNQLLGSFVEKHQEAMSPQQLRGWLERASGHNATWAGSVVAGVSAEVASAKLLRRIDSINGLRHGDLDEDLAGQDFVFDSTPSGIGAIDVKTGRQRPEQPISRNSRGNILVLSIDPDHMDGFAIEEKYAVSYAKLISEELNARS